MKAIIHLLTLSTICLLALSELSAEDNWDKENSEARMSAHGYLFDQFLKDKKCIFSSDKKSLTEVIVFKKTTNVTKTIELSLPEKTEVVIGMFDQLVIRGKNLNQLGVTFSSLPEGQNLREIVGTDETTSVFRLAKLPKFRINERAAEPKSLLLQISCNADFEIEEIAIRRSGRGLSSDFQLYQESLCDFFNDRFGYNQNFFKSTASRSFDELSRSLSESSEGFDRIVNPSSFGASTQDFPLRGVLADRRVSKLYEGLGRMDSEAAEKTAADMFDSEFERYQQVWIASSIAADCQIYGPQAHLFLCSEFCSPDVAIGKFDKWQRWFEKNVGKGLQFNHSAKLDALYSMNLQINLIRRNNDWTIGELNAFLAEKLGPSLSNGGNLPPTVGWGVLRTSDWTPRQAEILTLVPVFAHTSALGNPARHEFIFETLRNELFPTDK